VQAALNPPHGGLALFLLSVCVAVLTTFYMFRLVLVAFLGKPKSDATASAGESPKLMNRPLLVLAVPSVLGGFFGIGELYSKQFGPGPSQYTVLAIAAGLGAVLLGLALAIGLYREAQTDPLPGMLGPLGLAMRRRFYFDELYEATFIKLQDSLARMAEGFDRWIISGLLVRGTHGTTELFGRALRLVQTGNLQTYAFFFVLGLAFVLFFLIGR
jgi:NADH-quinone oxidoreductase subunit L